MSTIVEYDGVIVATTATALGLGVNPGDEVETWIPKQCVDSIEYDGMGDSKEIWLNTKIRSLAVTKWAARSKFNMEVE